MFFQLFTPQGLKGPAAAIQRTQPGKVRLLAQQITKFYFTGRHTRIFRQINPLKQPSKRSQPS
jgi:hypothetical protein